MVYDNNKLIVQYGIDVSAHWPENLSIAEVASIPEKMDNLRNWVYDEDTNSVVSRKPTQEEVLSSLENKAVLLSSQAKNIIQPLQYAVDLDIATQQEIDNLRVWKKYVVELNRISTQSNYPEEIIWPDVPNLSLSGAS